MTRGTDRRSRPMLVRAYLKAAVIWERAAAASKALLDGVALGLMENEALWLLDEEFYAHTREQINGTARLYSDEEHIMSGLHDWEASALAVAAPRDGARVLVTSAGAGREVVGLLERGFDAIGYEPNEDLVAAGKAVLGRHGREDRLRSCPRDVFPAHASPVDAAIIGWSSYSLIPERTSRLEVLRGARRLMAPGDPLILSFVHRSSSHYFAIVRAVGSSIRRLRGRPPLELGDGLTPNFLHYFSRAELEADLAEAGFECVRFELSPYAHLVGRAL